MSTSQKRRETGNLKPNYNYIAQAKTSELRQENQMVLAKEEPLLYTRMYRKNFVAKNNSLCQSNHTRVAVPRGNSSCNKQAAFLTDEFP